ncbi:NERD domain-containing protein, partial [Ruminococcus sp.]
MVFANISLFDLDKKTWILIAIAAAAALLLILYICVHFSKGRRKGRAAEKKVGKLLKKLGKADHVKIINNAYLPLYNKACEVAHLVFGRFGVLVVEPK